jgi:hypothetical protein
VAEVFAGLAAGWCAETPPLTAEAIASHLDAAGDREDYSVPTSMNDATRAIGACVSSSNSLRQGES